MKKTLLACSCLFLAAPALAADLPTRAPAPAPVYAAAPVFTWTGFYVGAQAGYAWGKDKWTTATPALATTLKPDGMLGGVHAGYNWQSGALVMGLEGDIEYGKSKATQTFNRFPLTSEIGARGSLRLRAGYAIDRTLLYVTGGIAGASIEHTLLAAPTLYKADGTQFGWTAGAGLEYAFTNNVSARVEYRYSDFGSDTSTQSGTTVKFRTTDHAVRVGLSYRFGGSAGPVVARY